MDDLDRDAISHEWSMQLMMRAFRDLAASFATVDPKRADAAVRDIEKMTVAEFERMLKQPPDGVSVDQLKAALVEVAGPFREMTQSARALIQQNGKPKN